MLDADTSVVFPVEERQKIFSRKWSVRARRAGWLRDIVKPLKMTNCVQRASRWAEFFTVIVRNKSPPDKMVINLEVAFSRLTCSHLLTLKRRRRWKNCNLISPPAHVLKSLLTVLAGVCCQKTKVMFYSLQKSSKFPRWKELQQQQQHCEMWSRIMCNHGSNPRRDVMLMLLLLWMSLHKSLRFRKL